jgi:hypothetical protein
VEALFVSVITAIMQLILKRLLLHGPRNTPILARWSLSVAIICAPVFALMDPNDPIEVIGLVLCILMNMLVAWLIEALHAAIAREERASAQLSSAVNALRQAEAEKVLLLEEFSHRIGNDYQRLLGIVMTQERLTREEITRVKLSPSSGVALRLRWRSIRALPG